MWCGSWVLLKHFLNNHFISRPWRLLHFHWAVIFGLYYTFFSVIYWAAGGTGICRSKSTKVHFLQGVNFINVLRLNFSYKRYFSSYVFALNKLSYKKFACLMLMKLTAGRIRVLISIFFHQPRKFFCLDCLIFLLLRSSFSFSTSIGPSYLIAGVLNFFAPWTHMSQISTDP